MIILYRSGKAALKEKAEAGNPGGRKLSVLDIPEMEGVEMPKPGEFLSSEQRDGNPLQATAIYENTWNWLNQIGCATKVSPQMIERYAMCSARWIQCEETTSKLGFLSKHPTTGKPIPSPFVNIGIQYMNQAERLWNPVFFDEGIVFDREGLRNVFVWGVQNKIHFEIEWKPEYYYLMTNVYFGSPMLSKERELINPAFTDIMYRDLRHACPS